MKCEGDTFEAALAHMLYIAVQVYQGRPVVELLQFVFGDEALPRSITKRLKGKVVTCKVLELRHNGTPLNMAAVVRLLRNGDGSPKYPKAVAEAKAAGGYVTRKQQRCIANAEQEAKNQLSLYDELWSTKRGTAWVEVSQAALPSAGVVLHIPGVLTLPVVCKDVVKSLPDDKIVNELNKMKRQRQEKIDSNQLSTVTATHVELSNRLATLGGDVVPVLCFSRHVLAEERAEGESVVCSCRHAIIADGLGEDVPKETYPRRQRLYETRLVRRSMFPFTLREPLINGRVTLLDACLARSPNRHDTSK